MNVFSPSEGVAKALSGWVSQVISIAGNRNEDSSEEFLKSHCTESKLSPAFAFTLG